MHQSPRLEKSKNSLIIVRLSGFILLYFGLHGLTPKDRKALKILTFFVLSWHGISAQIVTPKNELDTEGVQIGQKMYNGNTPYRFENLAIHRVFLRFSSLSLRQNLSPLLRIYSELPWKLAYCLILNPKKWKKLLTPTLRNSVEYLYREEEMPMMTVNEVSKLTGVSIRALQYYDSIGLLKPQKYTRAGYRLYDDTALERLQQIL